MSEERMQGAPNPSGEGAPATSMQGQATGPGGGTMPVPNRGLEAAALAALSMVLQRLNQIQVMLPVASDVAHDLREAVNKIAKHVPPGSFSQGVQMTEAQKQLMQQRQMGPQIAAMRGTQMSQMPGQAPPQPMA